MAEAPRADSPDILVFFCDQLRIDLLGCYGGDRVRTPNIDALAAESVVFDRAYTPCAICSPARASLMTGLYPHGHHMFNNSSPTYSYCEHLRPGVDMLPDWAAAKTRYDTAYFGKWHIGPAEDLFASAFKKTHPRPSEDDLPFLSSSHWHPGTNLGPLTTPLAGGRAGLLDVPMDGFPDVAAANYTRAFIREQPADRPFCAFCAFPGPHSPWMIPEEFGLRYDPADIEPWPNTRDDMSGKPLDQIKLRMLQRRPPMGWNEETLPEFLACLFSYMELIDEQVGAVVDELKRCGRYENTVVLFTADHGDMAGSHGFLSKGSYMYDETYRIPMILRRPAASPGRRSEPVHLMDATATLMDLMAGAPVDRMATHELHGRSLLPLLDSSATWPREVHYAEYHGDWYGHYSARMVTDGRWKLVWNLSDLCEFYDLENDPSELTNKFYDPAIRDVRGKYFELLREEGERTGDAHIRLFDPDIEDDCARTLREGLCPPSGRG